MGARQRLKTETNTPEMGERITLAARVVLGVGYLHPVFEHGQWWIVDTDSGAAWSVVDAEGGDSVDGFDFEQVAEGEL